MAANSNPAPASSPAATVVGVTRVRIFVDFWNFTLSVRGESDTFRIDWAKLGPLLTQEAAKQIGLAQPPRYEGLHVYGSYDPGKPADSRLKNWFTNTLDKMPGVNVELRERQRKRNYPKCPKCQTEAKLCESCNNDMRGTEEKGVDTLMATDLISLAWANAYDVAVLISSDRDFVPVAEFLQTKGFKIIHGAFPPKASELSQKCWANVDLKKLMPLYSR